MDSIVQYILNRSKLEISHIKITRATKETFYMAIECRVTDTGPLGATLAPMTVDMVGPKGVFGRVDLPEVKTKSSGTDVSMPDQEIQIIDMEAYLAFTESILKDEELTVTLDNGKGVVKALMMSANIIYRKEVRIKGMNGPKSEFVSVTPDGAGYKAEVKVHNPSPIEIDMGTTIWEVQTEDGKKLSEQRGRVHINRGETTYSVIGTIEPGAAAGSAGKLVGIGTEEDAWTNESLKILSVPFALPAEYTSLVKA
ncbi:hypothetical protein P152DRAFT_472300 [Eremomyces bilateralis CBS 781.70]|uniref:Uncharacterized protein n=1 Tax=Eremomyces bilateralis CBS 781.70 TaxID=1392243 RepID=A0A6G1G989_9PEZI|nr:uncharacterized protein P152DRAFT_472300 [Eremomyces bilateralis CBS 781.70]KAF1814552.1 hypothetical protein P152DRAFT_472300 [Eremomyces bilateralis CBS 781.70]